MSVCFRLDNTTCLFATSRPEFLTTAAVVSEGGDTTDPFAFLEGGEVPRPQGHNVAFVVAAEGRFLGIGYE